MSQIEAAFHGVLGDDAGQKTSNNGKPFLRLRVRAGEGDHSRWVSVLVFDEDAIARSAGLVKGAKVYVEGTLRMDEWDGRDGVKRHGLLVLANHCRLSQIGRQKPRTDNGQSAAAARRPAPPRSRGSATISTTTYLLEATMFGPWDPQIIPKERRARLRALRALALVFARGYPDFAGALMLAESGDQASLKLAHSLLDRLPALPKRRLLATYADLAGFKPTIFKSA